VSKSHKEVQVFINFANFYRRFIRYFSRIAADLTNLLKEEKKKKFTQKFVLISETKKAFEELKRAFISASMLMHFDSKRKILIETDVSEYALFEVISQ
jgi:DNA-binding transcriptional regulator/RsmH inhibitor MraZ